MKRNIIMTFDVTILQDILPGIKSIVLRLDLRRCHVKKQSRPHLHKAFLLEAMRKRLFCVTSRDSLNKTHQLITFNVFSIYLIHYRRLLGKCMYTVQRALSVLSSVAMIGAVLSPKILLHRIADIIEKTE